MPLPTTSNTPNPESQGLHCRINDNYYRLNNIPSPPRIQTAELQPPRIDTAVNPEDMRDTVGFSYSLSDFSGGEGLDFAHRRFNRTDQDPTRFWDSRGIDVKPPRLGEHSGIKLTPEVVELTQAGTPLTFDGERLVPDPDPPNNSNNTFITHNDNDVVVVEDASMWLSDPTTTTEDPYAGEAVTDIVHDLATLEGSVFAAMGAHGIHERTSSNSWSHYSDLDAEIIWPVKDRVLAAKNHELYEVASGAGSTLLHSLSPGDEWTEAVDGGEFILARATDGYLYFFVINDTSNVELNSQVRIGPANRDNLFQMTVFPGTNIIFYAAGGPLKKQLIQAEITTRGTLANAQVIREAWDIGLITSHGNNIYVAMRDLDRTVSSFQFGDPFIFRYDLTTGGIVREFESTPLSSTSSVWDMIALGDFSTGTWLNFMTVSHESAGQKGHVGSTRILDPPNKREYVATGHLISPLIDHYTVSEKSWSHLNLDIEEVPSGTAIRAYYSTKPEAIEDPGHASWTLLTTVTDTTNLDTLEDARIGVLSRYITIMIEMDGNFDLNPKLRSFTVHSYSGPGDIILSLPINTSDQIEVPGRHRLTIPRLGDEVYNTLRDLEGTSVEAELFDPAESIRGRVDSVESPILMAGVDGSETLTSMVTIRGRRV